MKKMKLRVVGLSDRQGRSDLVRIHWEDRDDDKFPRWSVAKLTCNGISRYVVVLGRDEDATKGEIELDIDHRTFFKVEKGKSYDCELEKTWWIGKLRYLLQAHDPMLRLPTNIALISLVIGLAPSVIDIVLKLSGVSE
ncbi:hypothetical protein FY137_18340 [Agrobacterium tumefaciens]|nr:hypothetical protein FY137_18340 [Agrobacterium tumefaciens]